MKYILGMLGTERSVLLSTWWRLPVSYQLPTAALPHLVEYVWEDLGAFATEFYVNSVIEPLSTWWVPSSRDSARTFPDRASRESTGSAPCLDVAPSDAWRSCRQSERTTSQVLRHPEASRIKVLFFFFYEEITFLKCRWNFDLSIPVED